MYRISTEYEVLTNGRLCMDFMDIETALNLRYPLNLYTRLSHSERPLYKVDISLTYHKAELHL